MSDLISREQALQTVLDAVGKIVERAFYGALSIPELRETIKKSIADVPTTYDEDKVVALLEKERDELKADWQKYDCEDDFGGYCAMDIAIKIVRKGGKK